MGTYRFSCVGCVLALVVATICGGELPRAAAQTHWRTGASLRKQLMQPIDIVLPDNPLREGLRTVSVAQRVAVLIDRRADPDQHVHVQLHEVPLQEAFAAIAESRQLGVSLVGPVVYVGPPRLAERLRTVVAQRGDEMRGLPSASVRKFLLPRDISWPDLATPRELLEQLGRQCGFTIRGLEKVPHDLWAAADLPALAPLEGLSLIAVQFDLTFTVSPEGDSITLVALPEDVAVVRNYPGGLDPQATAAKYATLAPNAEVKVVGDQVCVKGLLEDHEQITSPSRPSRPVSPPPGESGPDPFVNKRFTLKSVEQPLSALLKQLGEQLKLELQIDGAALQAAGISLDQRVTFAVEEATIDQLFGEMLKSTRLKFRRKGSIVQISPADP